VLVHRDPVVTGYAQVTKIGAGETVSPHTLPAVRLAIREIFPGA
jgi:hypothetical protein